MQWSLFFFFLKSYVRAEHQTPQRCKGEKMPQNTGKEISEMIFKYIHEIFFCSNCYCVFLFLHRKNVEAILYGLSGGASSKEPECQCRDLKRCWFNPWVRKIPWRRAWQSTPVFLLGESHGQKTLAGYIP